MLERGKRGGGQAKESGHIRAGGGAREPAGGRRIAGEGDNESVLRSMWAEEGLHNIYCHQTGRIVIKPFAYGVSSSAHKWIE